MARRNPILTFALCASLMLHGLTLYAVVWWYVTHTPLPKFAALWKPEEAPPIFDKSPPPESIVRPPPPPPPMPEDDFSQASKPPPRDDSGEANGKGTANRSSPGDQPMQAPRGYEQASLSRNAKASDEQNPSRLNDAPAQAGSRMGDDAPPQPSPAFGVAEPTPLPVTKTGREREIAVVDNSQAAPLPQAPGDSLKQQGVLGSPLAARNATPTTMSSNPPSTPREIKGVTASASDTESMPFANANSVRFHNGKVEGRKGRRVKTTTIEWGLAGEADAMALANPTVVLGVRVGADGSVQNVQILHSSGSENIDLPARRSVYNWWFEPEKDKDGHSLPDVWVVTID